MLAYEELKGSSGKEIWFRPPRFAARELFPSRLPRVRVGANTFQLHDIGLGGLSALSRSSSGPDLEVGGVVPLTIQQCGLPIFEAEARVSRVESTHFGAKIAFAFVDAFIEFDKLLNRNIQAQIAAQPLLLNPEAHQLVPKDYRVLCSDTLRFLRSYRTLLTPEVGSTREVHHGLDMNSAYEACEARMVEHWRSLWRTGNDLAREMMDHREIREATKEYTELVLTPEMRLGAIWDRSYAKPLGYPGDFVVMNEVYDNTRVGNDVYQMLIHRLGLEVAECIATRMHVVRSQIANVVRERGQGRTAKIMSLGCGSAREVELFLSGHRANGKRADFTLIDQEEYALRYAYEHTYPFVLGSKGQFNVQCLNMSFTDILRWSNGISMLPPQDMIYSVGLIDYLTDRRATALAHRLYGALAPGGLLVIGNMNETPLSNLWPMEFIADWSLEYRSEKQMMAWVEGLQPKEAWTELEPTERVRLLFVRKP
jgi:extracellular factor (EF) 3-hydroxypalmitic acid methyl ester biosynthesis protein